MGVRSVTASQFEDQEGRALVQAIHDRKALLAQPLPPLTNHQPRPEWRTTNKEKR
jgi:hypothetical protein